jgi:serine/threonine protein kinase
VFELDRDREIDFFTMELLDGEHLGAVLERLQRRPMSRAHAWTIIRELSLGLAHAHSRNVVHGDLNPQNVMITQSGEIRMLGFGAICPPAGTNASVYASCEILDGRAADARDDIFSLSCIAYELLTGAHPFQRRSSTVARDLGVLPHRPTGLTRQQWKVLSLGLSSHRAGRSMSASMWLERMNCRQLAVKEMPRARDIKSGSPNRIPKVSLREAALAFAALLTLAFWIGLYRLTSNANVGTGNAIPAAAAGEPADVQHAAPPAAAPDTVTTPAPPLPTSTEHPAGRSKLAVFAPRGIAASPQYYKIHSGENFAEIRVHRSSHLQSDGAFVWWTEAASAKPGTDYVHQGKVTQSFPRGKSSTSFFVKLVPRKSRSESEVFYVAIAPADSDPASGQVARAAIWLPVTDNPS